MARPKKPARRTPTRRPRKSRRRPALGPNLVKALLGAAIVAVVVAAGAVAILYFVPLPGSSPTPQTPATPPPYEVFPPPDIPVPRPPPPVVPERPKVAIIIDDLGYDLKMARKIAGLDVPLTFSIFPFSPFGKRIARMAAGHGWGIMVHMPMEPVEYPEVDPGPGALLFDMLPDDMIDRLNAAIDDLPLATGMNNHMGSRLTAASPQMNQVFIILKKRRLFFVDSRTTVNTVCRQSAVKFQVPFSQRDVFIDHIQDADFIRRQLRLLVRRARTHGEAVGIAHPYPITVALLAEKLPEIRQTVELVVADRIVRPVDHAVSTPVR